jgi:hypothetical protein
LSKNSLRFFSCFGSDNPPHHKEVNTYNPYNPVMPAGECATKRIPVCPRTWEIVHQLRKPGQTFDDVIRELVDGAAEKRLVEETRRIVRRGRFVPLSEIKS